MKEIAKFEEKNEIITADVCRLANEVGLDINVLEPPTQSSLQKYLREQHLIHFNIAPYTDETFDFVIYSKHVDNSLSPGNYKTYEEALEAGFRKAFELIKKFVL